jgi:hypothetical protein
LASAYDQQPDQAGVGSTPVDGVRAADGHDAIEDTSAGDPPPARDAGAARDRGEAPIGQPKTRQL